MNILVTGGAGFIGANLVIHLVSNRPNDHITVLDKLTYAGNLANLAPVEGAANYTFIKGDICDAELVRGLIGQADAVLNLAAESHVDRSIESADVFIKTNVVGVQTLLKAALDSGLKRFIQISTDEVYGSLTPDEPPFTEQNDLAPNSPYAASKAAADLLVRSYFKTFDLPVMITRCSNNYGPYQFPEKLIPLMATNAVEGKELPIYGDGLNIRDWIYVEDHCAGIEAVLDKGRPGEIYNFGGACELTNLELLDNLLKTVADLADKSYEELTKLKKFVSDRLGHDRRYAMAFDWTSQRLDWRPEMDIARGMKKTIAWYLDNQAWWQEIKSGQYMDYYDRHYTNRA